MDRRKAEPDLRTIERASSQLIYIPWTQILAPSERMSTNEMRFIINVISKKE